MAYRVLPFARDGEVASSLLPSEGRKNGGGSSPKIERRKLIFFKDVKIYENEFAKSTSFLEEKKLNIRPGLVD